MAERNPPSWLQAGTHTAENDRLLLSALWRSPGIVGTADLAVTAKSTVNMSVNVAAGAAIVDGTQDTYQGHYHVVNDLSKNLAVTASNATNPRVDIVVARVYDSGYGGTANAFALEVIAGTASATPTAPTTPDNALKLAEVQVAANATAITNSNITNKRVVALPYQPVGNSTGAYPSPNGSGAYIYRDTNDANEGPEYYHGTGWRRAWNVAWGEVAMGTMTTDSGTLSTNAGVPTALITLQFAAVTNRIYAIDTFASFQSSVANDGVQMQLRQTSNTGTVLQQGFHVFPVTVFRGSIHMPYRATFSTGTITVVLCANRYVGSGNALLKADSTAPAYILVRDVGPAGAPA